MIMLMLTVIGVATIRVADDGIDITGNEMREMSSSFAAEAVSGVSRDCLF